MRHELGLVLAPASLTLAWRRARPDAETDPDELRVVLLRSSGVGADERALGSTARRGLVPTIWIYMPTVALGVGGIITRTNCFTVWTMAMRCSKGQEIPHRRHWLLTENKGRQNAGKDRKTSV